MDNENIATLEQVANVIGDTEKSKLSNAIKNLHNAIVTNNTERATIPEYIFKNIFADYIFGLKKVENAEVDNEYANSPIHAMWATISGGPYVEVDVVDDETNEVLYTIPSLLSRGELSTDIDIDAIGRKYISENDRSPILGENFLNTALPIIGNAITPTEDIDSINFKWIKAFRMCYRRELAEAKNKHKESDNIDNNHEEYEFE